MKGLGADRLWPVIGVLVILLGAAALLEREGRRRSRQPIVIKVSAGAAGDLGGDEAEGADPDEMPTDDGRAPVDEAHAAARLAAQRGRLDVALDGFAKVVAAHPDLASLHAEYGSWLLRADKKAEGLSEIEKAHQLTPEDARVALALGIARRKNGDGAGAEREYRRALALRPGFGAAQVALGNALRRRGAHAEALQLLREAASSGSNADRAKALLYLGRAQLAAGQSTAAEATFTRAINRAPAQAELRLSIARAWLSTGKGKDAERALEIARTASTLAPDLAAIHVAIARALEKTGDDPDARATYERALRLDGAYHFARRRLLQLALDDRDYARAKQQADALLTSDPDEPEHHFLAGLVADREDRHDDARKAYQAAIERAHGDYPEAWYNLGLLEKSAGNHDEAIAAYGKALDARPDYLAALNNLGLAYKSAKRPEEAEAAFLKAVAQKPDYAGAWWNLGLLRSDARPLDAIDAFKKAIAARGSYPKAQLKLCIAYRKIQRYQDAIATCKALLAAQPRYLDAWFSLALAEKRSGAIDEARAAYREALALDSEHTSSRSNLAELEAEAGNFDEAVRLWTEVLDREPNHLASRMGLAKLRRRQGDLTACARQAGLALAAHGGDADATRLFAACGGKTPAARL